MSTEIDARRKCSSTPRQKWPITPCTSQLTLPPFRRQFICSIAFQHGCMHAVCRAISRHLALAPSLHRHNVVVLSTRNTAYGSIITTSPIQSPRLILSGFRSNSYLSFGLHASSRLLRFTYVGYGNTSYRYIFGTLTAERPIRLIVVLMVVVVDVEKLAQRFQHLRSRSRTRNKPNAQWKTS